MKRELLAFGLTTLACVLIAGCDTSGTSTETPPPTMPRNSVEPFYNGTLEVAQAPTAENPGQDLVLDLSVTFEPDSAGWPETYYGAAPGEDSAPINAAGFNWYPVVRYFDTTDSSFHAVEEVESQQRREKAVDLPPAEEADIASTARRSFQVQFPASKFEGLPTEKGNGRVLTLGIRFSFCGGVLSSKVSSTTKGQLDRRLNHCTSETVRITPEMKTVHYTPPIALGEAYQSFEYIAPDPFEVIHPKNEHF